MSENENSQTSPAELDETLLGVIDKLHEGKELLPEDRKILSRAKFSAETRDFLSRAILMGAYPTPNLTSEHKLAFQRIVGEAMAQVIRGGLQTAPESLASAEKLLASAEEFRADRTGEISRMWYVQAIVVLLLLLFSLFSVLNWSFEPEDTAKRFDQSSYYAVRLYLLAMVGGALGAGFSLLLRVGKERIDPATGRLSVYGEVLFRLTIGALAALIILFGMEADVFAGFLKVSSEDGQIDTALYSHSFWIIGIFSIVAGFCEKFVPSLLSQLSKSTVDKTGDKLAAESSNAEMQSKASEPPHAGQERGEQTVSGSSAGDTQKPSASAPDDKSDL